MDTRTLGQDLEVSAIGLGCMGMSQSFGELPDRDEMVTFLRDAVDRRWNIGEVLLPIMLLFLVITFMPPLRGIAFIGVYGLILFGIVDSWLLWRRTKRVFTETFGAEPGRGSAMYVVMRAFQMRGSRIPRPAVERGAELRRR